MEALLLLSMAGRGRHNSCFFAEGAREQGLLPGGIFWVIAYGDKETVLSSFLEFVQSLCHCAVPEEEKS